MGIVVSVILAAAKLHLAWNLYNSSFYDKHAVMKMKGPGITGKCTYIIEVEIALPFGPEIGRFPIVPIPAVQQVDQSFAVFYE